MALTVYGYVRGTQDIDLGTSVTSLDVLRQLEQALRGAGLHARLRLPDDEDPLGGVLRIWDRVDEEGEPLEPVEVVNFCNPLRPMRNPGPAAIRRAMPLGTTPLRCVRLADLIALKLFAGSFADLADVVALIERNPDADEAEIRATCAQYGLEGRLEALLDPPSNGR